jgi:phosphopantetheinyl transferase (holo-ACP synthase)
MVTSDPAAGWVTGVRTGLTATVSVTGAGDGALAMLRYGSLGAIPAQPAALFSDAELTDLIGNGSTASWAGKVAAKLAVGAVLRLVGTPLAEIEILPDHTGCRTGPGCRARHRPRVALRGAARDALAALNAGIDISITHESTAALAVAVLAA